MSSYTLGHHDSVLRSHGWRTATNSAAYLEHVRDEHSTFTWLLEPMLERVGFRIADATYDDSGVFARSLCPKPYLGRLLQSTAAAAADPAGPAAARRRPAGARRG